MKTKTDIEAGIIDYYRSYGGLNKGWIYLKQQFAIATMAAKFGCATTDIVDVLMDMRSRGLMAFRDGRPHEAEFHLKEWNARQMKAPTPTPPEPEPILIVLPGLEVVQQDVLREVSQALSKRALPPPPPVEEPVDATTFAVIFLGFQEHGRGYECPKGGGIVFRAKNAYQRIRSTLGVTNRQLDEILARLVRCGWLRYYDGSTRNIEFLLTQWEKTHDPEFKRTKEMRRRLALVDRRLAKNPSQPNLRETIGMRLEAVGSLEPVDLPTGDVACVPNATDHGVTCNDPPSTDASQVCEDDVETTGPIVEIAEPPQPPEEVDSPVIETALVPAEELPPPEPEPVPAVVEPTFELVVVPPVQAPVPHPVETALSDVLDYFAADDAVSRVGGLTSLTIRHIIDQLRATPLYKPLAEGDAETTVVVFEETRNGIIRQLREVDTQLSELMRRPVKSSVTDLRDAVETHLANDVPAVTDALRTYLMKYRSARRRLFDAAERAQGILTTMALDTRLLDLDMAEAQISVHGPERVTPHEVEQYAALVSLLTRHHHEFVVAHQAYTSLCDELNELQGAFEEVRHRANEAQTRAHILAQALRLIGADAVKELGPELDEAHNRLAATQQAEQEVWSELPSVELPRTLKGLAERLAICEKHIALIRAPRQRLFRQELPRQETLRRLMVIAIAHFVPDETRGYVDLGSLSRHILPRTGLMTEIEAKSARDAVLNDREDLLTHFAPGKSLKHAPTALCRERAAAYLADCLDPDGVKQKLSAAQAAFFTAYREQRLGK